MTTAATIADQLAASLRERITDSKMSFRAWSPEGADFARVYTGARSEYIEIGADGRVTTSQPRISWGHVIDEVIADLGLEG